ncbi:MAG: DUF4340 domain-containing protein [Clostridia bacterium]|nr:DUF4340 domain-containing protein [Clostridia bacterium]
MSKRLRNLLLTVGLLVVAGGALAAVLLLLPEPTPVESGSSDTSAVDISVKLIDKSKDADGNVIDAPIREIEITSPAGHFVVENDEQDGLRVAAYADFTPNTTKLSSLVTYLKSITATQQVKSGASETDLAGYGFGEETGTAVRVTYYDGTVYAFELGIESPGESGRYFRPAGEDRVYLVSTYLGTTVDTDPLAYISPTLITAPSVNSDDTAGSAVLRSMELTGNVRTQPVYFRQVIPEDGDALQHTGYVITTPRLCGMNDSLVQDIASKLSLTAAAVVYPHPTQEQIRECGLNEPHSVAQYDLAVSSTRAVSEDDPDQTETYYYNIQPHTVRLGKTDAGGNYYALVDDLDMIVTLMPSAVPWAEETYDTLVDPLLFMQMITDIQTISLTINGRTYDFQLTHDPDQDDRDLKMTVTCDGKTYSTPDMRILYQVLMNIRRSGPAAGPAADEQPTLTVELTPVSASGGRHVLAKLYKISGSLYLCRQANGEEYQVTARTVTHAMEQIENYLAGEKVIR